MGELSRPYEERDAILASHGYPSYRHYLDSAAWREKRFEVLAKRKCARCGRKAQQVHHTKYTEENLVGDSIDGLVPICRRCHKRAERTKDGRTRGLEEANRIIAQGSGKRARHRPRFCPSCSVNRSHKGGPCPPCRRIAASSLP